MLNHDSEIIIPRYKIILTYDVVPNTRDEYYQFAMGEVIPTLQEMHVYMTEVWHTAYGDYPLRMAVFVAEDYETIQNLLGSARWQELETKFKSFVRNFSLKITSYQQGFQFIR